VTAVAWGALTLAAYLIGTFPSARLVAAASGVDIHAAGSGNPGASNVTRTLGWRKGVLVYGLDALKGIAASLVGLLIGGRAGGHLLGAAAVIGHIFPIARLGRGGKGVASASGLMAVLHPLVGVGVTLTWLAISRLAHQAALASIVAVIAAPVGVAITGRPAWEVAVVGVLAGLIVVRHSPNIRRMVRHEELSLDSATGGRAPSGPPR
jgi:glycerol-3-phosphate acyltransferase PlsY